MGLVEVFGGRLRFCEFLRFLFLEPLDEAAFLAVCEFGNVHELAEMSEGGRLLLEFFRQHQLQPQHPSDEHIQLQQLLQQERKEYERLFQGPGPLAAPLWESVYRSREHLLFDETTLQVREQYYRFGLQFYKENKEPDDYLLIELEFLHHLINRSLLEIESIQMSNPSDAEYELHHFIMQNSAFQELLDAQIMFLSEHLTVWVPMLAEQIYQNSESKLYRGAAALLNDFIQDDLHFLLELKEVENDELVQP